MILGMDESRISVRFARVLLTLALRSWPLDGRRVFGPSIVDTALRLVRETRPGLPRWRVLLGEIGGVVTGGLARRRQALADAWSGGSAGLLADVRFAGRMVARSPGFSSVAVVTLAVGIGANTAVFSLADAVLLRPPPYEEPDRLALIWNRVPGSDERVPVAGPDAAAIEEQVPSLSGVAFTIRGVDGGMASRRGGPTRHVRLAAVTPDFFDVLGAEARLGRAFTGSDASGEVQGADRTSTVVVLAHHVWAGAFASDPDVVGATVQINDRPAQIIGVMPEDFVLMLPPDAGIAADIDVWLPLSVALTDFHRTDARLLDQDSDNSGAVIARLVPGAELTDVQRDLDRVTGRLRREYPTYAEAGFGLEARALQVDATAHARPLFLGLLGGVAVVLLVTCLNIGTLLIARGLGRRREFAVRSSLGAGRGRIMRQLAVEGAVLVGLGLAGAVLLTSAALPLLSALVPDTLLPPGGVDTSGRALLVIAAVSAVATVGLGFLPFTPWPEDRVGGRSPGAAALRGGPARGRGRQGLVVTEVALSVLLLAGAALMFRTVQALDRVRPGFDVENALSFRLSLRVPDRYRSPGQRARLIRDVENGIAALPDVRAVGLVGALPLSGTRWTQPYGLAGQAPDEWHANRADFRVVTAGYFEAMGIRVLAGRSFRREEDLAEGERVVVVDEKLARRIAPEGSAVGATIGVPVDGAPIRARVVGVVEHVRQSRLDADGRETIYVPYRQEASRDVAIVVRTSRDPNAQADGIRAVVAGLDPSIPVHDMRTLEAYVDGAVAPRRFALRLLSMFAGLAVLCAAIGMYGVLAFEVRRRTAEIGVRMAVGADRVQVVRDVAASGARLGAAGLAIGVGLSAAAIGGLRGMIYGISPTDPVAWFGVVGVVASVAAAATWVPALRASRLSPTAALRAE